MTATPDRKNVNYTTKLTDAPSSTYHVFRHDGRDPVRVDIGYVQPARHLWEPDHDWNAWTPKGRKVAGPFDTKEAAVDALIESDQQ